MDGRRHVSVEHWSRTALSQTPFQTLGMCDLYPITSSPLRDVGAFVASRACPVMLGKFQGRVRMDKDPYPMMLHAVHQNQEGVVTQYSTPMVTVTRLRPEACRLRSGGSGVEEEQGMDARPGSGLRRPSRMFPTRGLPHREDPPGLHAR